MQFISRKAHPKKDVQRMSFSQVFIVSILSSVLSLFFAEKTYAYDASFLSDYVSQEDQQKAKQATYAQCMNSEKSSTEFGHCSDSKDQERCCNKAASSWLSRNASNLMNCKREHEDENGNVRRQTDWLCVTGTTTLNAALIGTNIADYNVQKGAMEDQEEFSKKMEEEEFDQAKSFEFQEEAMRKAAERQKRNANKRQILGIATLGTTAVGWKDANEKKRFEVQKQALGLIASGQEGARRAAELEQNANSAQRRRLMLETQGNQQTPTPPQIPGGGDGGGFGAFGDDPVGDDNDGNTTLGDVDVVDKGTPGGIAGELPPPSQIESAPSPDGAGSTGSAGGGASPRPNDPGNGAKGNQRDRIKRSVTYGEGKGNFEESGGGSGGGNFAGDSAGGGGDNALGSLLASLTGDQKKEKRDLAGNVVELKGKKPKRLPAQETKFAIEKDLFSRISEKMEEKFRLQEIGHQPQG
jgi:hypothetical protein